jgi:hypothetical protein
MTRRALFLTTSTSSPCLFLKTHLIPVTFTLGGGSTKFQTWFLSKFSNFSCMTLNQLESESACPTCHGSNRATNNVLVKHDRCADLENRVTLSFKLPMISWGGCAFWMWDVPPLLVLISSSNPDACTSAEEEVVASSLCFNCGSMNKPRWWNWCRSDMLIFVTLEVL